MEILLYDSYDETVILDTDMIFPFDVSSWWEHPSTKDVWACTNVKTFRGEKVEDLHYLFTYEKKQNAQCIYSIFLL